MKRSMRSLYASSSRRAVVPAIALRIWAMQEIRVRTERRTQLLDITSRVQDAVNGANGATAALVFVPHTTAGVTINEHADPAVARDFEAALGRTVGDGWGWQHMEGGEEAAPGHSRATLRGQQAAVRTDVG